MGQVAFYNKTFWILSSEFSLGRQGPTRSLLMRNQSGGFSVPSGFYHAVITVNFKTTASR